MNRIDQHAIDWVAREDAGPLDSQQQAARDAWLQADPRHLGAYARARAMFVDLDRLAATRSGVPDIGDAAAPPASMSATRMDARAGRRRFLAGAALAASVALATFGGVSWLQAQGAHETRLGEVLRVPLQDGSVITLNSDSKVRVRYDAGHRDIELLRGEALFDVAKDPARPFAVHVDDRRVVAVGTSFSVQREPRDGFQVVVREGVVEVDAGADTPPTQARQVRLAANFSARAQPGAGIDVRPVAEEEVDRRLVWRDGMIAFNGDTLGEAARQFARYSQVRILIEDASVADRRVVGLYSATDPAGFARTVASSLGLRFEQQGNAVRLRPNDAPVPSDGGNQAPTHREY